MLRSLSVCMHVHAYASRLSVYRCACRSVCQSWLSLSETPQTSTCTVTYNHQWRGKGRGGRLGKDSTGLHFSRILFRRISGNDCASESHPPSPFIPPCMHSLWYIHTHPDNIQSVRAFRTQRERNRGREGGREQERERGGGSEKEREREDACVLLVL